MAANRIYNLTPQAVPDDADVILIDNAANVEPHSITYANLIAPEETGRIAVDNAIIAGAGLEADGHLDPVPTSNYIKNADFTAAGFTVDIRNGLRLLDTAILNVANAAKLSVQVTLTTAEILALNATPVLKMDPPLLNFFYQVDKCIAKITFNSVPYVTFAGNGIYMRFTAATDYIAHLTKAFVESAADLRYNFEVINHEIHLSRGIEFFAPDGDPINGDSKIDIIVEYMVRPDWANIPLTVPSGCCVLPIYDTFVAGDLNGAGELVVVHGMGTEDVMVFIQDNNGVSVAAGFHLGDALSADTLNQVTIAIGAGIPGTWRYFIIGAQI